ncbi:MAG: hypothetical protein JWM81_423 [Candidatus Saccharibacteria bacterium]|nr:hypothetical protein [Candidatus Saccharibacteria bacterium]
MQEPSYKKLPLWRTANFRTLSASVLILAVLFATYLVMVHQTKSSSSLLYEDRTVARQHSFDTISQLESEQLKVATIEPMYAGDMARFIQKPPDAYIKDLFDATIRSNHADAIWTYNTAYKLISNANDFTQGNKQLDLSLSPTDVQAIFAKSSYTHFYKQTDAGLIEVFGVVVYAPSDAAHSRPPYGYFMVGRVIDKDYLAQLSTDTRNQVTLESTATPGSLPTQFTPQQGVVAFYRDLRSYDGTLQGQYYVRYDNSAQSTVFKSVYIQMYVLIGTFALLCILIFGLIYLRVLRPLGRVYDALLTGRVTQLKQLLKQQTEFGRIANLLVTAQQQKAWLSSSVKQTDDARKALERRTNELESINKLMVNRELRMIELKQEIKDLKAKLAGDKP